MSAELVIIAAVGADGAIGRRGDLAFHISADLRHFKQLTMGCPVIMGRRTFESLPKGALPGRRNIVISRDAAYAAPGAETALSLDEAVSMAADAERAFIIGGGSVYAQAMPMAHRLEVTGIDAECPGADTFFPAIGPGWELAAATEPATDERTGLSYTFKTYKRHAD